MLEVMKCIGFGAGFWVGLNYYLKHQLLLSGLMRLSSPFKVTGGTAQGSPLSLLFALAIEPLALAIRQNSDIKGMTLGVKQHQFLLYADDIL